MTPGYPEISLYVDGGWCKSAGGKSQPVLNPATGEAIGTVPMADPRRSRPRARRRRKGLQGLAQGLGARPLQADAQGRRHPARPRRRHRQDHDARTGQAARRGEGRDAAGADIIDWFAEEAAAPMAASSRRAPTASISSWSRSRSDRSPPSRRGTSRSTRRCARSRPRSPPAARSSSRGRRRRRRAAPPWSRPMPMPGCRRA